MTIDLTTLDAHAQPSDRLRAAWKSYSRTDHSALQNHPDIDDVLADDNNARHFSRAGYMSRSRVVASLADFHDDGDSGGSSGFDPAEVDGDVPIFFHPLLPGLLIMPGLIPPSTQKTLLSRMVHRDLSNPTHQTNLHLHYELPYPDPEEESSHSPDGQQQQPHQQQAQKSRPSFFAHAPDSAGTDFTPKDPSVHRPLTLRQVLQRKLSWVTLGGQYDWTNREYPDGPPPGFPPDIAGLLHSLFPDTTAQAAIVNFYSPGDTMMMHRDVSEHSDKGLVSISLGCEALFMAAPNEEQAGGGTSDSGEGNLKEEKGEMAEKSSRTEEAQADGERGPAAAKPYVLLRLRSGDAIYMTDESRYAWHGVPKVLKNTCPEYLADWPGGEEGGRYDEWKGWMRNKRINLNVRQIQ